jgi:DNA-directed RNA polymerase sigma subunit (sigma70/sigma32)
MKKREISNETRLMAAIGGPWFPDSNKRYYDEIGGISLHDALITAVNGIKGFNATEARTVITERFGIIDGRFKTYKEVAEITGFSSSKVPRVELSGLRRIRHPSNSTKLKPYIK